MRRVNFRVVSKIACSNQEETNERFKHNMCEKGNCKFFINDKCEKKRIPENCARKGLKNK